VVLKPGVQAFKDSNPQLFNALQLLWIAAVIGTPQARQEL
jgi:hypothetical protein